MSSPGPSAPSPACPGPWCVQPPSGGRTPIRDWRQLLPAARARVPELLVLGSYRPDDRTGPAIWLRCVIDGRIQLPNVPDDRPPVVYLPGIERGQLRAGENCPEHLRPLVELLYRGAAWHHSSGRDWSARAFLTLRADGVAAGPGPDIAGDSGHGRRCCAPSGRSRKPPWKSSGTAASTPAPSTGLPAWRSSATSCAGWSICLPFGPAFCPNRCGRLKCDPAARVADRALPVELRRFLA